MSKYEIKQFHKDLLEKLLKTDGKLPGVSIPSEQAAADIVMNVITYEFTEQQIPVILKMINAGIDPDKVLMVLGTCRVHAEYAEKLFEGLIKEADDDDAYSRVLSPALAFKVRFGSILFCT